jgi:uncharacterized protein YfaS (alpha-2-macroglobulin family)
MLFKSSRLFIVSLVIVSLFTSGCKRKKESFRADDAFKDYISAFTSGIISGKSSIRIVLASETTASVEPGKETDKKLFSFSPEIKGKTVWLDKRTVEFTPDKALASGQVYEAEFFISRVASVPKDMGKFTFRFQVIQQSFEVMVDNITTTDKKTLRLQRLTGILTTADIAEKENVSRLLIASQSGKELRVKWQHEADGFTHRFTIDSIIRKETPGVLLLSWKGEALGIDQKGSREVEIPALGDFRLLEARVEQGAEQFVMLQFSDPLLEAQNLDGLISISDNQGSLRFLVEDNVIKVYPPFRLHGNRTLTAETGIKNILGFPLKTSFSKELKFEDLKPAIRLQGNGVILPGSGTLVFPFEAVSLSAVDVKVIRIYENNILQFLQQNDLRGQSELTRVGSEVLKKTITLAPANSPETQKWNTYSLDMSDLIKTEPGAIYRVTISFKQKYSTYNCTGQSASGDAGEEEEESDVEDDQGYGNYYYNDEEYYDYDYNESIDYSQRDNPCNKAYYSSYYNSNRTVSRNVLASDLGLIAKEGNDGSLRFAITDLKTTDPIQGAVLELYDYQQQLVASLQSDSKGMAETMLKKSPFFLVARHGSQRGYLRLDNGSSLSLSMFDVSGEEVQKGIKGFIYGERGVWRPGDTLFLNFILEHKSAQLPEGHPVTMELLNPQGQLVKKMTSNRSLNGFYSFPFVTDQDAPTGNWMSRVKVGGVMFNKPIKIETIMPNRLKINLKFAGPGGAPVEKLMAGEKQKGVLDVKWLHGAVARNLKAKVEVTLSPSGSGFPAYPGYVFEDPGKTFSTESQVLFDGKLDNEGKAVVEPDISMESAPGIVNAAFNVRVFEEGGSFSVDRFTLPYYPYTSYVGIKAPEANKFTRMLETNKAHAFQVATVDANGRPVSKSKLTVQVYKISWRWWWDSYNDESDYTGSMHNQPVQTAEIRTVNGKGIFNLKIDKPEWGRFLVRISDPESGHSSAQTVYLDWPSWAGSSPKGQESATLLAFTSDKEKYATGEKVKLTIPSGEKGRVLISIESGSKIIKSEWVQSVKPQTFYEFEVTPEMAPNIYVSASLLQPAWTNR